MITERPFIEGLGEAFKENVYNLRPQNSLEEKLTPQTRLTSLNTALETVSTLHKNQDLPGTVIAFGYIIANASPMAANYLNRVSKGEPIDTTEETIIYTLCQAANDAAKVCLKIANTHDLPEEAKDSRIELSLVFIKRAIYWGTKLGDPTLTLRALNNSTQINTDRAMRRHYQENSTPESKKKARDFISSEIKRTKELLNWAKGTRNVGTRNLNIEFVSAICDEKKKPTNDNQLSLKYIANTLNRLGVLNLLLADMTQYPDTPIDQILEARKVLKFADQFHMKYLIGKEPEKVKEFEQRRLAIQSNLGYTYITEMFKTKNFDSVNLNELYEVMDNVRNNFIANFLIPLGSLDKVAGLSKEEVTEVQSFFRMESITRSLEILGIMLLSHTDRSTTLSREYQNLELAVYNSIIAHFKIRPNLEELVGEYSLLNRTSYLRKTALVLKSIGETYLKKEGATADNEDRIFFEKALEALKSTLEVKTSLNWPQI